MLKGVVNLVGMEEFQICFSTIELWYLSEFCVEKKIEFGQLHFLANAVMVYWGPMGMYRF